jgi:4-diphosphocytidyl-2-C-methyl-D-erythritol kinase
MSSESWITQAFGIVHLGIQVHEVLPTGQLDTTSAVCFSGWSEQLRFRPSRGMALFDDKRLVPRHQPHPVRKAVKQLSNYLDIDPSYRIDISRKLPRTHGLSLDAALMAQTIRALCKLEGLQLSTEELADLARPLHPDVVPCLYGQTGLYQPARGQYEPTPLQPNYWMLAVQPPEADLNAEAAFYPQYLMPEPDPVDELDDVIQHDPIDEWRYVIQNELETGILPDQPQLGNIKDQMYEFGAFYSVINERGPVIIALFDQDFVAHDAYNRLLDLDHHVHLTPPGFSADWTVYEEV